MNIDDYLDAALKAGNYPSDRQLGFAVGKSGTAVSQYRTKRAWPDDETMVKIATLADLPTDQALIDLNIWRSKNSEVVALYQKIATAVSAACFAFFILGPSPANATGTVSLSKSPIYTLCDIYILSRDILWRRY